MRTRICVRRFLAVLLALSLTACGGSGVSTWEEQYDLGMRYLSEGSYEEAISAFQAAVEMEPKNAELYMGLAGAYIGLGNTDEAVRVLTDALALVEDEAGLAAIQARLDELTAEPEPEPDQEPEQEPDQEPEPDPEPEPESEGITWTLDGGTLTISGKGPMEDYGWELSPWNGSAGEITSAIIQDGVTSIGANAFLGCESMTSVSIPNSVTSIGNSAFQDCYGLTSVSIPDSVTSIGNEAFCRCYNLTSANIPTGVTRIEHSTFQRCSLTSIVIPDGVTYIGAFAFLSNDFSSVTIPASVTAIDGGAFELCTQLTSVVIPSSVTSIEANTFVDCESLTDIYYGGTEEQWAALTVETDIGLADLPVTIHYSSAG